MLQRAWPRAIRQAAVGAIIGAVIVLALGLFLAVLRYDPTRAAYALFDGAFGSWYAFASGTLVRGTPLVLTGLAVAVAFRAGVFNVGAEGQFLMGATAAAALALYGPALNRPLVILLCFIAGSILGALWAAIAAILRTRFHVLEVISTIMLNFAAMYLVSYLVRGPMQEPTHVYPQTAAIPAAAELPRLPAVRLHLGFFIALAAAGSTWWVIRNTAAGFRLRATGANPDAARSAGGVNVNQVVFSAFAISGALAGLAGAIEVQGVTFALYENISPGYGYTAIAVALLARLDAALVVPAGILFGALEAGAAAMQRDAGVPSVVVAVVEAALILALLGARSIRQHFREAA
jgi:general nucleoside transport system permease protein